MKAKNNILVTKELKDIIVNAQPEDIEFISEKIK